MRKLFVAATLLTVAAVSPARAWIQETLMPEKSARSQPLEHHAFPKIAAELAEKGAAWKAVLENDTMTVGVYRLAKGATDGQSPHGLDEIYHVVAGRARFRCEEEDVVVGPGSVLFVAAHAEHRFHAIEEDLEMLVFFSKVPVPEDAGEGPRP